MIRADKAWQGARRLADELLGDPEDLCEEITKVILPEWNCKFTVYALDRFPRHMGGYGS
jgi:hypothetical protein